MGQDLPCDRSARCLLVAEFEHGEAAERALQQLNERDFPLDRVSILGGGHSSGDDPLGVYYAGIGERIVGWGRLGALWGGLVGLVGGAAGLFLLPGTGAVVALGPIAEALAGGATGAAVGGGAMAGAAAVSYLAVALRRMGVPEDDLERLETAVREGRTLLFLHLGSDERERWRPLLEWQRPMALTEYPEG